MSFTIDFIFTYFQQFVSVTDFDSEPDQQVYINT